MEQRRAEEQAKERKKLLDRILPRIERFGKLSKLGIVAPRDGKIDPYRREYWSLDGKVEGWMNGEHFIKQFTYEWDKVDDRTLERLAKIKKFDPIEPKNPMQIIAEAAAGLHDDL